MRIPESLVSLTDEGILDGVLRPLMSGKEAQVYLVSSGGETRVAKVYKEAKNRSFRQRAEYTEGRRVRNTRDQRAIDSRSRHGRDQDEAAWRSAEVDTLYRLHEAGVRVPTPYHFVDGVLIMELVTDADGNPAPRLGDVRLDRVQANGIYHQLLAEVVRMLCAGVVHGDLSDFNVLLGQNGPVIIDFPQSVSASSNQNARKLLLRDVDNLHRFLAQYGRMPQVPPYGPEMWQLYQCGELTPDTKLLGRYRASEQRVDTHDLLASIGEARRDAQQQQQQRQAGGGGGRGRGGGGGGGRQFERSAPRRPPGPIVEVRRKKGGEDGSVQPGTALGTHGSHVATEPARPMHGGHGGPASHPAPQSATGGQAGPHDAPVKKRRRRRRRKSPGGGPDAAHRPNPMPHEGSQAAASPNNHLRRHPDSAS